MDLTVLSTCPVCYEIIREPVMFPCKHEICLTCFKKSLETANHWCPICRKRISSWARRNVNNPVSSERKRKIDEVLAKCDITLLESTESTKGRQPSSWPHVFCVDQLITNIVLLYMITASWAWPDLKEVWLRRFVLLPLDL